jgi:tryptophan-rich sensory protein
MTAPASATSPSTSAPAASCCGCEFLHKNVCPWFAPDRPLRCDAGAYGAVILATALPNAIGFAGTQLGRHRVGACEWFKQLRKPDWYPSCGALATIWTTITVLSAAAYLRVLTVQNPQPCDCQACSCNLGHCLRQLCPAVRNQPEPAAGPAGDGVRRQRAAKAILMQSLFVNSLWGAALLGARSPVLSLTHTLLSVFATFHAAGAACEFDRKAGLLMLPLSLWMCVEAAMGYALVKRNVCGLPDCGGDKVCQVVCNVLGCKKAAAPALK